MQSVIGSKRLETTGILKIKHKTKITTEGITRICNFEKTLSKLRKKNIPLTKYEINAGSWLFRLDGSLVFSVISGIKTE